MAPVDDEPGIAPLVFPDPPPAAEPTRAKPSGLSPLNFDEVKPVMSSTPAPSVRPLDFGAAPSRAPAPLDFSHVPERRAASPAPAPAAPRAPKGLDFSSVPPAPTPAPVAPRRASAPVGAPTPIFDNALTQEEQRALDRAQADFPDLFRQHASYLRNTIKQLLPFSLSQLENYGRTALEAQGQMVTAAATITRDFRLLDANGLIQEALTQAQGKASLIDRLRGHGKANLNAFRVRAEALRVQLSNFLPRIEGVRNQLKEEGDRLPLLLAALSSAASAVNTQRDVAVDISVNNRRTVLTQAVQQRQVLLPQLEEMRRQAVEQLGALENFLQTTLPALELAAAQA